MGTVDAFRIILSFNYLFQTVLDKLFLICVSMLVYISISVLVVLALLMILNGLSVYFNVRINNQKLPDIGIFIATAFMSLPVLAFFYSSRIRFIFPLKDHVFDIALISALGFITGILMGYPLSKTAKAWESASKGMVVALTVPFIAAVGVHLRTNDAGVSKEEGKPNVVLIVADTLRADHLSCYGYHRVTSPHIDAMAKEGVQFRQAVSQAPWTLPSIVSLMTSLYPPVHGLNFPPQSDGYAAQFLDDERITLAEYLRNEGYKTGAFVGAGGNVSARFHGQGFDFYDDEISYPTRYSHLILLGMIGRFCGFYTSRLADTTTEQVQYWLSRNRHFPFFLFIHYFDPHDPYGSPEPFTTKYSGDYSGALSPGVTYLQLGELLPELNADDIEYVASLYDGEIRFTDAQTGKLIQFLKELELLDETLLIFTSDHGDELYEHGGFGHCKTLYEEQLRVPLIIRYPPLGSNKTIDNQVQLIDVTPTILDYLDIDISREAQGISLVPLINGDTGDELPAYSETMLKGGITSIRKGRFKFIKYTEDGREELFDLEKDPGELKNLVEGEVEIARQTRNELSEWIGDCKEETASLKKTENEKVVSLDERTTEQLRTLGYLE